MKEFFMKKNNIIILVILILVIFGLIWFSLFYIKQCNDKMCFYQSLKLCNKASFISEGNITLRYKILGQSNKQCIVNVELLDAGLANKDRIKIKNLKMNCYLPYQVLMIPESDLALCHGELKEAFQDLIINKLHTYIVKNLGEINQNILKV